MTITIEHAAPPLRTPCLTKTFKGDPPQDIEEVAVNVPMATGRVFVWKGAVYYEQFEKYENRAVTEAR